MHRQESAVSHVEVIVAAQRERVFHALKKVSKFGKRDVMVYILPDTELCYSFAHVRTNNRYSVYRCFGCKGAGISTHVKVSEGEFLSDPSQLPHQCTPKTISKDIAVRKTYEDLQHIRADKRCVGQAPKQFWHDTLDWTDKNVTQENGLKDKVEAEFYGPGYSQRRDAYSSAPLSSCEWATFSTRTLPGLHIFNSVETIQEACRKGLYVLVADGTFGMHPVEAGKKAQLYCIHGVCSGGVEVPLLHSVTDRKTIAVYKKIFGHIKKHLTLPRSRTLRVILDFEKASIRAARMVFLNFEIEGCSFHLSQAWNRRRDDLGLKQYIHGDK
ncbi:hypothetical protein Aduo_013844 [Ancylostoma duodenale]